MPKRTRARISLNRGIKRSDKKLRKVAEMLTKKELAEMLAFLESARKSLDD